MERTIPWYSWILIPVICISLFLLVSLFPYEFTFPKPEITTHISVSDHFTHEQLELLPPVHDPKHSGFQYGASTVTLTVRDDPLSQSLCASNDHDCSALLSAVERYGTDKIALVHIDETHPEGSSLSHTCYYALDGEGSRIRWIYLFETRGFF
ncbi:hypothetical protein B9T39_04390 [Alloscardovia macacae]|uniref:Uncharacterized protein n=1 Tax=Alloscardovia macacae TaxID=1160091 RepID=A0A1Y2T1S0_9BIFI|nr:hypothetical protein B9T39_04390 [Alloscardovia macacae]